MADCPILKENEELKVEIEELKKKLADATEQIRDALVIAKEKPRS